MKKNYTPVSENLLQARVGSVDVYRGFVMFLMMAEVLKLSSVSDALPDSSFWHVLAFNQSHVPWAGLSLHDLIQPSFTFLVGVVLPYSLASRQSKGDTKNRILLHTFKRSLILIFLGIFLRSLHSDHTNFTFEDTLTQIGLGYTFLVLLAFYSPRTQLISLSLILLMYWLAFALYPLAGADFDYTQAGVPPNWPFNFDGFAAHWNKNTNAAWAFDHWFLPLFPGNEAFLYNSGGYSTLSFIPTLGTMILGLFAGQLLRSSSVQTEKLRYFMGIGVALLLLGAFLHFSGLNPIVKRIWTPAWTLFSGGLCFILLAFFYGLIDVAGKAKGSLFLKVIGVNSIAAYVIADGGMVSYISKALSTHLGPNFSQVFGGAYPTLVSGSLILLIEWLILYWMYKKKLFIKI